jgi:hypothetical protein
MPDRLMNQMGQQKYREASQWWATFELAIHRYRCWTVLWRLRCSVWARLAARGFGKSPPQAVELAHLSMLIDEAHDHMLIESDSITMASRAAVACEMAGRIFDEEYDGRETHQLQKIDEATTE